MAAVWPPSLPQVPLAESFDEELPDTTLRTTMDAGPAKVRRRFSVGVGRLAPVIMYLDDAQQATFWDFFVNTINGGADRFEFTHPRLGVTSEVRIVFPTALPKRKPGLFRLQMQLEVLP